MLDRFKNTYYSFPVQLIILHFRSHHLLTGMWLILFLIINGSFGAKFGMHYLFLDPEYLGKTGFWSYFILGIAFGCFFLTWNLTNYLLSSHHFPFLATLRHPFSKFCLNNFIIPLSFLLFYLFHVIQFKYEDFSSVRFLLGSMGFFLGNLFLGFFYFFYFRNTNRDITYYRRSSRKSPDRAANIKPGRSNVDLNYIKKDDTRWRVDTYLSKLYQVRRVRSVAHYESKLLMGIFKQNHLNALVIQVVTILLLMFLGLLTDYPAFRLPAGASFLFFLSIFTAIIGALSYWLHKWLISSLIVIVLFLNYLTSQNIAYNTNKAYGLDYKTEKANYSLDQLECILSPEIVKADIDSTLEVLEHWKEKNTSPSQAKPKMIILSTSGGGLTSATWVLHSLLRSDSLLQGALFPKIVLMTGASGGTMGNAYLRELLLKREHKESFSLYSEQHVEDISKDLLNSVTFMLVANDLFIPWTTFEYQGYPYFKDRGYIFEKQINENTNGVFDKSLISYRKAEKNADIPMLYVTSSILNDGRKFIISPLGVSFMMSPPEGLKEIGKVNIDGVDFRRVFENQNADSLRFLTALRMNATFPYVLPSVHLPSTPELEALDAGYVDNYGVNSATRFIQVFKDWILENTSGVILLQTRTMSSDETIGDAKKKGIITSLLNPVSMVGQIFTRQEFEQDNNLGFLYDLLGEDNFHHLRFDYIFEELTDKTSATISFHITEREKLNVKSAFNNSKNQSTLQTLQKLLNESN